MKLIRSETMFSLHLFNADQSMQHALVRTKKKNKRKHLNCVALWQRELGYAPQDSSNVPASPPLDLHVDCLPPIHHIANRFFECHKWWMAASAWEGGIAYKIYRREVRSIHRNLYHHHWPLLSDASFLSFHLSGVQRLRLLKLHNKNEQTEKKKNENSMAVSVCLHVIKLYQIEYLV